MWAVMSIKGYAYVMDFETIPAGDSVDFVTAKLLAYCQLMKVVESNTIPTSKNKRR